MIRVVDLTKAYSRGNEAVHAIRHASFEIADGDFVVIRGASGSGKSSLLNILGCLDRPTSGVYELDGDDVSQKRDTGLSKVRSEKIGFVFQSFHLLPKTTALENVELPMIYADRPVDRGRASAMLERVGLAHRAHHYATQLSGGEQQRVAIARALVNDPPLILADEPTGNLDETSGTQVMALLGDLNREGRTIVLVTHDDAIAAHARRTLTVRDGVLAESKVDMKYADLIGSIGRSLLRNKLRSALMMLSVTIGIASLMILSSIGDATKNETLHRFKNMLGTFDTVIIRPGGAKSRGMVSLANTDPTLTVDDATAIAGQPSIRQVAEVQNALDIDVKYRNRADSAGIFGVTANWPSLRGDLMSEGNFLDAGDIASLARVAVIGADIQTRLFGDEEAVGKTIRIGDVPFLVKGVLVARGAGPTGASLDNVILIPVTTASKRLFNRDFLTMVIAQLNDPATSDATIAQVTQLLRGRHHLAQGVLDDFTVTSPRAVMAQITALGSTFETLLSIVAVLATVLGGLVITIVTLIGISSRKAEIGLKRAVGAPRNAILVQFLAEAVILSLAGGLSGIAIGVGATQIVAVFQHLPLSIDLIAMLGAVGVSVLVGLIFGVYPALRAARVDPIEALRA